MALTRENTRALNTVSDLTAAQRTLEAGLTTTRKTMFADPVHQRRQVRDSAQRVVHGPAGFACRGMGLQGAVDAVAPALGTATGHGWIHNVTCNDSPPERVVPGSSWKRQPHTPRPSHVCLCVSAQEVEERDTLVQLVNAQAQEVERLKAQIMALRRKDTSVYS